MTSSRLDSTESKNEISEQPMENILCEISCPITGQIFYDPVSIDGCDHIFERSALEEYKQIKNENGDDCVCPMCRHPLQTVTASSDKLNLVEKTINTYPTLQNQRFFTIKYLSQMLYTENFSEVEKICSILKSSDYLNAISEEKEYEGSSALTELTAHPIGRSLLAKDPDLRRHVSLQGLNAVLKDGFYEGTSAVYWLLVNLEDWVIDDKALLSKITSESLNNIFQEGGRLRTNLVTALGRHLGLKLIIENKEFRAKITPQILNDICPDCDRTLLSQLMNEPGIEVLIEDEQFRSKIMPRGLNYISRKRPNCGISALTALTGFSRGRELLVKDKELQLKITEEGLNCAPSEGSFRGLSALMFLAINNLLGNCSIDISSKITSAGLNRISQQPSTRGRSPLSFLINTALIEDKEFRSKITAEGLNYFCKSFPDRGKTALTSLLSTAKGREIFFEDKELQSKISSKGLNSVIQEGPGRGLSPLIILASTQINIFQDNSLRSKITPNCLNAIVREGNGESALIHFLGTEEGRAIFFEDPELQSKVTAEGLNSIVKGGNFIGKSPLLFLISCFLGRMLLLNNQFLFNSIDIATLMHPSPEGEFEISGYSLLVDNDWPEGKELLKKLQPKIDEYFATKEKMNPRKLLIEEAIVDDPAPSSLVEAKVVKAPNISRSHSTVFNAARHISRPQQSKEDHKQKFKLVRF